MKVLLKRLYKKILSANSGSSLAEFAVVTAMMATFISTSVPKFSDIMEVGKEQKTKDEIDKIITQGMSFYNETSKSEGRGRFPGQEKFNRPVGSYTSKDDLLNDIVNFSTYSDSSNSAKWISVFGINNEKAPMPSGAYFTDDTLQTTNCSNCSENRFPGHEEWLYLFANETLISPYQDGHYIYIVIPGSGSGIDAKSPILFVADAENPSRLYKLINI
tara:strand:+ start:44 stop:694 length:651 start_codon:yes stop_codon:yes gene_type:complete